MFKLFCSINETGLSQFNTILLYSMSVFDKVHLGVCFLVWSL